MAAKPEVARVKLADRIERQITTRGIEIEVSDGTAVLIPPPELWDDTARSAAANPKTTSEDFAKVLMGADQWAKFLADGGTPRLFDMIVREHWDASAGESSGSSTS